MEPSRGESCFYIFEAFAQIAHNRATAGYDWSHGHSLLMDLGQYKYERDGNFCFYYVVVGSWLPNFYWTTLYFTTLYGFINTFVFAELYLYFNRNRKCLIKVVEISAVFSSELSNEWEISNSGDFIRKISFRSITFILFHFKNIILLL